MIEILLTVACFSAVFFLVLVMAEWTGLVEHPVDRRVQGLLRVDPRREAQALSQDRVKRTLAGIGQRFAPSNERDRRDVKQRLALAGYYHESAFFIYWGARLLLVIGLPLAALLVLPAPEQMWVHPGWIVLLMAGLGFVGPDLFLRRKRKRRQDQIFRSLPDALDLLVVCLEAGLGLDAALHKVSEEFGLSNPELCDELRLTCAAIRLGKPRNEALHDLGERTGVVDLKALSAVLIQSDRFGTSSAEALRVHAQDMRTRRRQRAEEMAAKTTVKLIFPLVGFIFPSIFVVLGGPAVIRIMDTFLNK